MVTTDLTLGAAVQLRLIDASERDRQAVIKQTGAMSTSAAGAISSSAAGAMSSSAAGEPDIVIRFVPRLPVDAPLRHLVMGEAGFTPDGFSVFQGERRALLDLAQFGARCEIVCESGASEVPLLLWAVHLAALGKGILPLHASAFQYNGRGVVASGWPKGGKTSSLFAFVAQGARFVSDDWLHVDAAGSVSGLLHPIKLSDWQLEQLPQYRARLSSGKLRTVALVRALDGLERRVPDGLRRKVPPFGAFHLGMRYLNKKKRHVYATPSRLFSADLDTSPMPFDTLLLTLSHESPEIVVRTTPPDEALDRLIYALLHEWQDFMGFYVQYRYAFPQRANPLIDTLEARQRALLAPLLAGKQLLTVHHPHPVPLPALYAALAPHLGA